MKKVILLFAAVCISLGAFSQKGKVTAALSYIDQGTLDKAKEALDQAFNDEKSKDWFNTYFAKGKLCQAIFTADNPKYNSFYGDPLAEAYEAYEKALALDTKGTIKKRIITGMIYNNLANTLYSQGSKRFTSKDYEGALKSFSTQIKVCEGELYVGAVDTGMYYNAGLAAINCGKYTDAIKYFQKCCDMKYMGITPYYQIYQSYMDLGDTTKAESFLLDLPKKFPGDNTVTLQLIDLYIKSNKYDEAFKYIKVAKEQDPSNYSLYFASGIIFLNQNKYDDAITELTKALEMKQDIYDLQYATGVAYINKAADMFKKANDIMDVNKYTEAVNEANSVYAKAMPYMEKALQLKPNDVYALRSLKELYYRLKMTDKYNDVKAKLDAIDQK
ncbi:MAG: tetratricopeptide repeat protein [Bacteroidales bacterium]|jgi:tetratricopeptide (TPR) repeat protein